MTLKMTFRQWCMEKWFEHKDELLGYNLPLQETSAEYFARYKHWLRREYRHQQGTTHV